MRIAVEGCCHGELDKIYETLQFLEKKDNMKVDLLLICGDFQAVRNRSDLQAMAVPQKYQKMNTFFKYYNGERRAPVLTVFIGGNHEASNYLQELPYGGWVAPNIYYMGYANVLNFGGVRIGGISGIFKGRDYSRGHFEHPPYNEDTKRSVYHVRSLEVFRLKQLKEPVDIMLSHDWPRGVYNHGNVGALLSKKRFLRDEVESNTLGSPPLEELLHHMQPGYWFSAHLHVKFAAHVLHQGGNESQKTTKFLSLDKCLPRRKFLQVVEIPQKEGSPLKLQLDSEWLAVLRSTNHLTNLTRANSYMPGIGSEERYDFTPSEAEKADIDADFQGMFSVPENFEPTAAFHNAAGSNAPPQMCINPQTSLLCSMLELTDPFAVFTGKQPVSAAANVCPSPRGGGGSRDDSAVADDSSLPSDEDDDPPTFIDSTFNSTFNSTSNLDSTNNLDETSAEEVEGPVFKVPQSSTPKCTLSERVEASGASPQHSPLGKRSPEHLNESTESATTTTSDSATDSSPTKAKKFKRRNQSMYNESTD